MSAIFQLLDRFLGRTFALWILGVLAVVMAGITVVESFHINPPTPFPWYQTPWFFGLLFFFSLSILVVCLGRDQFRVSRWPQLATHLGLVILLIGGFGTHLGGVRGYLDIEENRTADRFQGETPLLVIERDNLRRRVDLGSLEDAEGRVAAGPKGGRYEVSSVLTSARRAEDGSGLVLDPSGRGRTAVFVKPEDGGAGAWIIREGPLAVVGSAKVRLSWMRPLGFKVTLLDAREVTWAASSTPSAYYSWIRIDDPDESFSREWLVETNAPLSYKGFSFYQSGMPSATRSVFQVTRDPGLLWVTIGICLTGLGLIVLFASRFVRDPLAQRRRHARVHEDGESPPPGEELVPTPARVSDRR